MATAYNSSNPYDVPLTYDGDPPSSTPQTLPYWELRATSLAGVTGPLPAAVLDQVAFEFSTNSALTFTIPEGSTGYALVNHYTLLQLYMNGTLVDDGQWTVRGLNYSGTDQRKVKQVTAKHRLWDALERTQVMTIGSFYPKRYYYGNVSIGWILNDLLVDAQARLVRTIKDLTWTFNGAHDTGGTAWPEIFFIEYKHGTSYASIFQNWVDRGLIEVRLRGNELQVYIADKMGKVSNADLIVGRDVTDAPIQETSEGVAGVLMVVGDEDISVITTNPTTVALYGREELSQTMGGTSDRNSLILIGEQEQTTASEVRQQRTYGVVMRDGAPSIPIRDYAVSDWVRITELAEGQLMVSESFRARQIVLSFNGGRVISAALVLNDKFLESEIRMNKKVDGIIGGAVVTGTSRNSPPAGAADKTIPGAPTALGSVTGAYVDDNGITKGTATLSWVPPGQNTDGTTVTDVSHYRVWWKYTARAAIDPWTQIEVDGDPIYFLNPLDPGQDVTFFVQARDDSGHWSGYSASRTFRVAADTVPPPVLPAPALTSYLGTLGASWNGLGSAGELMPSDYDHTEVWVSRVSGNAANAGTLEGVMHGAGDMIITGYSIGETVFCKFVSVDRSGNRSADSAESSKVIRGVSGPDIEANSVTTNNLAAGAVTAAKIQAGAVTTDKLTLGQTLNLVQDPSFNDPGWRARRLTTEFAELPAYWFFYTAASSYGRNGAMLQCLSTAAGVNGGRMYMTDWMNVQMGEKYYAGMQSRDGFFAPNAEARLHIGVDVEKVDGTLTSDYLEINPSSDWFKDGYNLPMQQDYRRIRYWVRAFQLNSGDFLIDDFEVRCMVGTTALTGGRVEVTPMGINMWDPTDQQTILIDAIFGDVGIRGQFSSGFSGKRIVLNPGSTYLPEMRFYPTTGNLFAYINASDTGTYPFIGVNAPDTGAASQALVLFDSGFQLGEVNKATGVMAGAGVQTSGTGNSAYIFFTGRLGGGGNALETLASYRFNIGTGSSTPTVAVILTKPPNPSSGQWMLLYSVQRAGTGQLTASHINQNSTATSTVIVGTTATAASFTPNLTTVNTYINHLWIRSDGDV